MNAFRKRLIGAGLSLVMLATGGAAQADDLAVYLTTPHKGDAELLKRSLWQVFAGGSQPGVTLEVWDGTHNKRIANISVPDETRYKPLKRRARMFARETSAISGFLDKLNKGEADGADRVDVLSVLRSIGENRLNPDTSLHVLVFGSPIQTVRAPGWSMTGVEGALQVPSDHAIRVDDSQSPYGTAGRNDRLKNVYVHMCVTDGARRNSFENGAIRRVWAHWLRLQGGALVTWAKDINVCFERLLAGTKKPLDVAPLTAAGPIAMVEVAVQSGDGSKSDEREQPEVFNLFRKERHPAVPGLIVYTGVEYLPENYPHRYVTSWCYFNSAKNDSGVQVRIDVGNKEPGQKPTWRRVSEAQLGAAGVSRSDFEQSKSACRFPADG